MSRTNRMQLRFASLSENESFARVTVAAFVSQLDPTMEELTDIKTVVSEAVTNAIIHGYDNSPDEEIEITAIIEGDRFTLTVEDKGKGIEDLELARQPLYTSKPELERSGMGFTIIENFMDEVDIVSQPGHGTKVVMVKQIESKKALYN
ncbi:anti-sigma F factor [Paenibacillus mesophilus]|uniref:anti-sigma F factor n=1 Tax=Paenibacillus mesophilus TaxID=2582849 RepID=UPI00110F17F5|nr:anti-sigma F factor [Paenibacillus mesophilus]TMV51355.1 anti-sigma F factor [Paenibacillus mesophilus]